MKIYNWIDSWFDTYQKRATMISIAILAFWIWQNIWQAVFLFDLIKVDTYETLFSFYTNIQNYTNSFLVGFILNVIAYNRISVDSIFMAFVQNIHVIDIVFICMTLILFFKSEHKKKWLLLIILYIAFFAYILICIMFGFNVDSIGALISLLKILSIGSFIIQIVIICLLVYKMVGYVLKLAELS